MRKKNLYLFQTAKFCGVNDFSKFNNAGYKGLYNETAKEIALRKGIDEKEEILDYMDTAELGANLFRITQTDLALKVKKVDNEEEACTTHYNAGKEVRKAMIKISGIEPEKLETPKKSINDLEKDTRLTFNVVVNGNAAYNFSNKNEISGNDIVFYTDHFVVITALDNVVKNLSEIKDQPIGVLSNDKNYISNR